MMLLYHSRVEVLNVMAALPLYRRMSLFLEDTEKGPQGEVTYTLDSQTREGGGERREKAKGPPRTTQDAEQARVTYKYAKG